MDDNASNRTTAFKLLDKLIKELNETCQKAKKENSPGLMDLKRILDQALGLQKALSKNSCKAINWRSFSESVFFLIQMAKKIHSLIFNCFSKRLFENAIWKSHKTITCFQ